MNMPERPYVGMPAGVRKAPSVAPADICGTIGVTGHIWAATLSTGFMIPGVSGGGALITSLRLPVMVTLISGSATSAVSLSRTSSAVVPGKMRQFKLASARWGWALVAWPPLNIVGMHVVWMMPI